MCDKRNADNETWSAVGTGSIKLKQIYISRKQKVLYLKPHSILGFYGRECLYCGVPRSDVV